MINDKPRYIELQFTTKENYRIAEYGSAKHSNRKGKERPKLRVGELLKKEENGEAERAVISYFLSDEFKREVIRKSAQIFNI